MLLLARRAPAGLGDDGRLLRQHQRGNPSCPKKHAVSRYKGVSAWALIEESSSRHGVARCKPEAGKRAGGGHTGGRRRGAVVSSRVHATERSKRGGERGVGGVVRKLGSGGGGLFRFGRTAAKQYHALANDDRENERGCGAQKDIRVFLGGGRGVKAKRWRKNSGYCWV